MSMFEQKIQPKQEPIKNEIEPKKEPVQSRENNPTVLLSEMDAYLYDTFKSQPKSLEEVDSVIVEKPLDGRNRLSLPRELEPYTKKYAFCWINKKRRSIDEARIQWNWIICNRTFFPDVVEKRPDIFTASGAIEQGDAILGFRTHAIDEMMRRVPGIESLEKIKARTKAHEGDERYYVPEPELERGPDGKIKKIPVVGV